MTDPTATAARALADRLRERAYGDDINTGDWDLLREAADTIAALAAARAEEREACATVVERLAERVTLAAEDLPLGAEKRPGIWPEGVSAYNLERFRADAIKEGAAALRARGEEDAK